MTKAIEKSRLCLYVCRGLPGSGKSTWSMKFAKKNGFVHIENDMFVYNEEGKYVWTLKHAKEAMRRCYEETEKALNSGKSVIVSNVFVTKKSVNSYRELAKKCKAEFKVFRKDKDYGNIHSVPKSTLLSMMSSFEDIPGEVLVDKS